MSQAVSMTRQDSGAPVRRQPHWRGAELALLVLPCLLVVASASSVLLARGEVLTAAGLWPALVAAALALVTHGVLAVRGFRGDQVLLPLVIALTAVGVTAIFRIGADAPDVEGLAVKQVTWLAISLTAMVATVLALPDPTRLRHYKYTAVVAGLGLVAVTLVLGRDLNESGARLWLALGPAVFQPSEILKVLLVVFFAGYLDEYRELISRAVYRIGPIALPPIPYLLPLVVMWGASLLLMVIQRDLGAAMLYFGIFLALLYVASSRFLYVLAGLVAFAAGAIVLYRFIPVVHRRVEIWLDPWSQSSDLGYQVVQALIGFGSGGLLGAGLGRGQPYVIPAVHTDFVLAAVGEELGLAGSLAVVALYLLLIARGYRIAQMGRTTFEQLLAAGLVTVIALQSLVILGGNLKLIPLTGITLPFVSYGGSSLLTNFMLLGLLLRISERGLERG